MTSLTDLPDELLIRCLAGSGGMGIGAAAAACTRLCTLAKRLQQLPVFSSAASTNPSLQHAITDAGQRALAGCFGVVDFAILFVANYGLMKNKKYSDPTDVGHAVEMLRAVLGQDVVIVGCAAAGVMGVGPDSQPFEVDPLSDSSRARAILTARRRAGLPPPPSKGVSVLLGKLPVGCVARGLVFKDIQGPIEPAKQSKHAPPSRWTWPALEEALTLTSSQKAALAQQLAQAGTARSAAQHAAHASKGSVPDPGTSPGLQSAEEAELDASPETAAAAEGLLSVVASASAAAAADAAAAAAAAAHPDSDVELVPQMCLLLYDSNIQYTGQDGEVERAFKYLAARDAVVVGGASSGSGDLFFSPGADARRVVGDPPSSPMLVGLLLCTARASAAAVTQHQPPAAAAAPGCQVAAGAAAPAGPLDSRQDTTLHRPAAAAAKAGPDKPRNGVQAKQHSQPAGSLADGGFDSSAALRSVALSAEGMGPISAATPLFADLCVTLGASNTLNFELLAVNLQIHSCSVIKPPAQQQLRAHADAEAAAAPHAAAPMRRSARLASAGPAGGPAASGQGAAAAAPAGPLTPLQEMCAVIKASMPSEKLEFDWEDDDPTVFLALWLCAAGEAPDNFSGDDLQAVIIEPLAATYVPGDDAAGSGGSSSSSGVLRLMGGVPTRSLAALKRLVSNAPPGSRLCCQVVSTTGPSCAGTVQRSLAQLLALVNPVLPVHPAAAAAAADASASQATGAACGAGAGAVADGGAGHGVLGCYSALARCAVASGARSGLSALAVCSCTGRGQQLYMPAGSLASFGDVCEAAIIDRVAARSVPFAGVYVSGELGPEVQNQCVGWAQPGGQVPLQPAEMQGYTSMFAAWGCQPGAA